MNTVTATASLFRSTITGATTGVQVNANGNPGMLAQQTTQNTITGNTTAIAIAAGAGTVRPIFENDLSGNTTSLSNGTGTAIDASGNYWGSSVLATVSSKITGPADYTPYLNLGGDTSGTAGFQGNFSDLTVHASGNQTGATGRIQEGIVLLAGASLNLAVLSGTYTGNVDVNKALTLARDSPGIVNITGDLIFSVVGSTLSIEVNGTKSVARFDQIIVSGTVDLNGADDVNNKVALTVASTVPGVKC